MIKLNKEIMRKIVSFCEKFKVETDLIDIESLWDNSLTEEENLSYLKKVIEDMSLDRIEGQIKIKKTSVKLPKNVGRPHKIKDNNQSINNGVVYEKSHVDLRSQSTTGVG